MLSDDDGEYDLIIVFIIHNSLLVVANSLSLRLQTCLQTITLQI